MATKTKEKVKAKKPEKVNVYIWHGTDRKGKKVKGESRAQTPSVVKAELRKQGITPSKVSKKIEFGAKQHKIVMNDIAVFARQLATMLDAGVPLVQSFDIVGKGHDNPAMSELILSIKADLESGTPLAAALAKKPLYFDDLFCNLVDAGEQAGVLEDLLDKIATYKEKTEAMKKKIKKALTYPLTVIAVAVIVTVILLLFVIPVFQDLFTSFGADLPAFTQMVINLSISLQNSWHIILGVGIVVVVGWNYIWKRSATLRANVDRLLLRAPIFGGIVNKSSQARFARTLSTMFAAGVPLVEALESVSGATGNIVYEEATLKVRDDVSSGQSLQVALKQHSIFPHLLIQMVAIGEESGALDDMLGKVADYYEADVDDAVDNLSTLMEPLIMSILGILVGGLVVAMYLPIFKLGAVV